MSIQPKILNRRSSGYGDKVDKSAWKDSLDRVMGSTWTGRNTGFPGIKDLYDVGEYQYVIEEGHQYLRDIKSEAEIANMDEADLAAFFYLGMSYLKTEETDRGVACLHIVLSQNRFVHKFLIGFSQYVDLAFYELNHLSVELGEKYVNKIDPLRFLSELK